MEDKDGKNTPTQDQSGSEPAKIKQNTTQVEESEEQTPTSEVTQTEEEGKLTNPTKKDSLDALEGRSTCYVLLTLNGILVVSAIVLISSCVDILMAKPCDLEKALDLLGLDEYSPCAYSPIKDLSIVIIVCGVIMLVVNLFLFLVTSCVKKLKKSLLIAFVLAAIACFIGMGVLYIIFIIRKAENKDMDFGELKATMLNSLENTYTSDNISSSNAKSNNWNRFFIEYNCCGINQVQGTTNDFDITPWCTTSGSCQATASQIPKTCCNYVTEDDYGSAPSDCHSSVNPGTYKSNCVIAIKLLSVTNIEEYKISLLQFSLQIIWTLELCRIVESIIALVLTKQCDCCDSRNKVCNKDEEIGNKIDKPETTNKNTNELKDLSSTERTETENQNKLCRFAESIIALVLKKRCDCCNRRNKVCNEEEEIGNKNDKPETTNKNTDELKDLSSTERTETENQNKVNG